MTKQAIMSEVVVVGAGGCGLTAALVAAERGKRVLLLERDKAVGGTTAMSAGLFVAANSPMQQASGETGTAEELAADIFRLNGGQSDQKVTEALCKLSGRLMSWLAAQGVSLEHLVGYRYPGMRRDWLHAPPQRHGAVITDRLLAAVQAQPNIELLPGAAATGLTAIDGVVNGITATRPDGGSVTIRARAVILAASGFGANREMVTRFIPEFADAPYYGGSYSTGDAIRWGLELGAAADGLGAYQSHSSIAHPNMMLVTTYLINHGAIQVNQHGQRFGDETDSYAGHALAVQAQPGGTAVEIFDDRILSETLANYPRFDECIAAGIVHRADNLIELAGRFGLPEHTLAKTVSDYGAAARSGADEFGRKPPRQPLTAPYYGVQVTSALVQTLGGLRVDDRARVLYPDGNPLPGLYAGGGTAAGLAGERPEGYMAGAGLLAAFGLGWLAGRECAGKD